MSMKHQITDDAETVTDARLDQPTEVVNPILAEIRRTMAEMHDYLIARNKMDETIVGEAKYWAERGGYNPETEYRDEIRAWGDSVKGCLGLPKHAKLKDLAPKRIGAATLTGTLVLA